jgi:predicted lactoylglutathione lyase
VRVAEHPGSSSLRSMPHGRRILEAMNPSAPLANLITLGARDLPALRDFYRALGWPQIMDDGEFVAFELRGIVLALFPLARLASDGNTDPEPGTGGIRFTIGVQVDSADEVDRLTEQMRAAGARVTKEPVDAEFFTGRSAYLCDPEGNYFEIAWVDMPNNPVVIATRRAAGA